MYLYVRIACVCGICEGIVGAWCVCFKLLLYAVGRGRLRINKIENVGKALTFLTQEKKVYC